MTADGPVVAVRRAGRRARPRADDVLVLARRRGRGGDDGDGLDGLRALCVAHWTRHPDDGAPRPGRRRRTSGAARRLDRWGLAPDGSA